MAPTHSQNIHPFRQPTFQASSTSIPLSKRPRHHPPQRTRAPSIAFLKSQVRDLTRLLEHVTTLPANVRVEKERALAAYQIDLEAARGEKHKRERIKRYKMVRFMERQKATRALKKLNTQLSALPPNSPSIISPSSSTQSRASLQRAIHSATVDLNYTLYFPLTEKYQSLYARNTAQESKVLDGTAGRGEDEQREMKEKKKPPLWETVERCAEEGTRALELLRDRKGPGGEGPTTGGKGRVERKKKSKQERENEQVKRKDGGTYGTGGKAAEIAVDNDGSGSDGGFFEE